MYQLVISVFHFYSHIVIFVNFIAVRQEFHLTSYGCAVCTYSHVAAFKHWNITSITFRFCDACYKSFVHVPQARESLAIPVGDAI